MRSHRETTSVFLLYTWSEFGIGSTGAEGEV